MPCRNLVSTLLLVSLFTRNAAAQSPSAATPAAQGPSAPTHVAGGRAASPSAESPSTAAPREANTSRETNALREANMPREANAPRETNTPREANASELEAARALFEKAREDESARRWGDALVKFRRILATKDTASLRFHAAYCEENMGLVASAMLDYERAAELAQGGKGPDRKLILEGGARSRSELAPRVPTLALELPEGAQGAQVNVDGEPVPTERLGAPLPLDPGYHLIEVVAPGKRAFQREVRLVERERHRVSVLFEAAIEFAPPGRTPEPRREGSGRAPAGEAGRSVPTGAWVAGGAGVAFAGAGAIVLAKAIAQRDELERCRAAIACDGREVAAASNRNLALAGAAGGLALAGAGTALWLALGPASKAKARAKAPTTGLMFGPTGVGWRGVF